MSIDQYNHLPIISQGQIGEATVQTVNARDLHAFLEVGTAFKDWIVRRVEDYNFQENLDFCSFLSESSGGRPSKEYAITIDMAKELSMVERNEKGKQARRYFIECERELRNQDSNLKSRLSRLEAKVDILSGPRQPWEGYASDLARYLENQALRSDAVVIGATDARICARALVACEDQKRIACAVPLARKCSRIPEAAKVGRYIIDAGPLGIRRTELCRLINKGRDVLDSIIQPLILSGQVKVLRYQNPYGGPRGTKYVATAR